MADPTSPYFSFWAFPQRKPQKKVLCVGVGKRKVVVEAGGGRFSTSVREEMCSLSMFVHLRLRTDTQQALPHTFSIQNKKACLSSRKHTWIFPHKNTFSEIEFPALSSPNLVVRNCLFWQPGGHRTADRPCQDRGSFFRDKCRCYPGEEREGWKGGGKSRRHAIYAERKGPTEKADTTREASRADTRPFPLFFLESPRGILLCLADTSEKYSNVENAFTLNLCWKVRNSN